MCAAKFSAEKNFAWECSAALEACFGLLPLSPSFPAPWHGITPSAACRQTVTDPAHILGQLRHVPADQENPPDITRPRRFDDSVLRAANLLRGPDNEPFLNRRLCGVGRYIFAVRDPFGRRVVDLLTPVGLLSGKRCGAYSVIVPWPGAALVDTCSILGTTSSREAALLLSLGFPVALFKHIKKSSARCIRDFWEPCWTTVPGCKPLIDLEAATCSAAKEPVTSATARSLNPDADTLPDDAHDDGHTANHPDCPTEDANVMPQVAEVEEAADSDDRPPVEQDPDVAAGEQSHSRRIGPTPGVIQRQWRLKTGEPLYSLECLIGYSLIHLSDAVPIQVTRTCADLRAALVRHHAEHWLPKILMPEASDLEMFRDLLEDERPLDEIQEQVTELLLNCQKHPADVWPDLAAQFTKPEPQLTVIQARTALLQELDNSTDTLLVQQAHDRFAAAVDREVVQPLRDLATGERRPLVQSLEGQYAEAIRNATLLEPYAVYGAVPRDLKIDVPFDHRSPVAAHRLLQQRVLTLLKMLPTVINRR